MRRHRIGKIVAMVALAIVVLVAVGFVIMTLWNWLMPALFGLHAIGYWQAIGILVLSKLLFGGFRGGAGRRHWRHRIEERWEQMTPEEREKAREGMRHGWCRPATDEPKA